MNSKYKQFHTALKRWYRTHGRHDLPWRTTTDPYAVYISEVMLQQTQVKTVVERFYDPFMRRFPTLQSLADAPEQEVLKQWQGLGYYSRARNLHRAAQIAAPTLPDSLEGLLALPGIGQNTAHAILAFGYRQPYAVMEANVKRVLARLLALASPPPAQLWHHAEQWLNRDDPFDYNQAMMDLGALICTPKAPRCDVCPAAPICKGKMSPERYPEAKANKAIPTRIRRIVMLYDEAMQLFCTPRTSRFLGGLYGFIELEEKATAFTHHGTRYPLKHATRLGNISHVYSHFRLEAEVLAFAVEGIGNNTEWKSEAELAQLPISKADEKAWALWRLWQAAPQQKARQKRR